MILEILTPDRKLYSGNVYGVQLPGLDGLFEVLENHAPLVSALGKGKVKIVPNRNSNSKLRLENSGNFQIDGGFVEVLNNRITILAEGILTA